MPFPSTPARAPGEPQATVRRPLAGPTPPERSAKAEWLFYDGSCRFCVANVRRWRPTLERRGIGTAPLQTPWVQSMVGSDWDEMKVLTVQGELLGGVHAALHLARRVAWLRPVAWIARLPGITPLLGHAYRFIAARRHCLAGSCPIDPPDP